MQTFVPMEPVGFTPEQADFLRRMQNAVQAAANAANDSLSLRYLNSAPARPQDGAVYLADGTNFNPGSGKGAYRFAAPSTYTFLG